MTEQAIRFLDPLPRAELEKLMEIYEKIEQLRIHEHIIDHMLQPIGQVLRINGVNLDEQDY